MKEKTTEKTVKDRQWKNHRPLKAMVLYLTMVLVSTLTIYILEHSTIFSAFRTALVAAVGKTFAASWVTAIFE